MDDTKKQSKQELDKKGKQKQTDLPKEITFETEMEKVEQLEAQGKFNDALMALPRAEKYPDNVDEIFLFKDKGNKIKLTDPLVSFPPEAVLNFYAQIYPILTTAKIEGPEIKDDELQFKFVSTIGTKR